MQRDLVGHRKVAIAKAFLLRKPGETPSGARFVGENLKPMEDSREDEDLSAAAEYSFRRKDLDQHLLPPKTQEPKPTGVTPAPEVVTIPEYLLTFQTGVHLPPLHPVLTSVRRRFLDDTGDILMSSKIRVLEQIEANFEAASQEQQCLCYLGNAG